MADHPNHTLSNTKQEKKIPVFTVLKNNTILKNIYLINTPPSIISPNNGGFNHHQEDEDDDDDDVEDTLLVGRHPDCDIRLEHPSISRFHLRIHSKPFSSYFSVTDLSSVHGTWMSGRRIEPRMRTEMNEGDTLRVGGSTRIYRLHWIPLAQAYDFENPFVPSMDLPKQNEDKEEENGKDEASQEFHCDNTQLVDHVLEPSEFSSSQENTEVPNMISLSLSSPKEDSESPSSAESMEAVDSAPMESVSSGVSFECFPGTGVHSASLKCRKVVLITENRRGIGEELDTENEDEQWLESVFDGFRSLFVYEGSAQPVHKEVSASPPTLEADDSALESLRSMFPDMDSEMLLENEELYGERLEDNSALESLRSTFPDMGSESFVGNEMLIENEDVYGEQLTDEETHSVCSVFNGLEALFVDEDPLLEVESPSSSSFEAKEKEQVVEQQISDEDFGEGLTNQNELREDYVPEVLVETDRRRFQHVEEAPEPVLSSQEWSETEVQEKLSSSWYSELTKKLVDAVTCGEGVEAEVDMLQNDENHSSASEQNVPWSFWSAALSAASLKLSPPISGLLLEAESFRVQRDSRDMVVDTSSMEKENEHGKLWGFWSETLADESAYSSLSGGKVLSESDSELINNKGRTPESPIASDKAAGTSMIDDTLLTTPANRSNSRSIWSRRGNPDSAIQVKTNSTRRSMKRTTNEGKVKYRSTSKALFSGSEGDHEELFTPDKENYTPNTQASMRKLSLLKELQQSNSTKSYLMKSISSIGACSDTGMSASSNKENWTPKVLGEKKSAGCFSGSRRKLVEKTNLGEKMPFQCLLDNSSQKSAPLTTTTSSTQPKNFIYSAEARSSVSVISNLGERMPFRCLLDNSSQKSTPLTTTTSSTQPKNFIYNAEARSSVLLQQKGIRRRWNMIVDNTCLLNKESRKALQLLEGLKGTRLIIPRIVIRELDSMKRQATFFRRKTEVSAALQWIEECMERRKWWMHIQSSTEEGRSIASTPPATPQSLLTSGISGSGFGLLPEIVSPTTEDHVLDYALYFRRFNNDGHQVLLTNSIALKVSAMAEGLICETAEEFRESLLNPFSEKFLWADSSPRGQTWSFFDDIVLRQNFYPSSLEPTCKAENMKGLKLILVNNSQHGHTCSIR